MARRLPELLGQITEDPPPFNLVRLAVNEDQIARWNLPAKPTRRKVVSNTVEAESIPAHLMRETLEAAIALHSDPGALERTKAVENAERDSIRQQARFLGLQAKYGGDMTLTDGDGDRWVVGESGSIEMEATWAD